MSSDLKALFGILGTKMVDIDVNTLCLADEFADKYFALKKSLQSVLQIETKEAETSFIEMLLVYALDHIEVCGVPADEE